MQLKIQRSQRRGITNVVIFCLDIRADYSPEERDNIRTYGLGGQPIYNSRAARRHLDSAGEHLERTQVGTTGERAMGLARGVLSIALAKMQLNITISSLGRGHHIACKDLEELLEAEDTLREACKSLTRYLEVAATFDGSEVVITYENGEERVHIAQNMPPLLSGPDRQDGALELRPAADPDRNSVAFKFGKDMRDLWDDPRTRKWFFIVGGAIGLIILYRLIF